jgi:hypothetical protein
MSGVLLKICRPFTRNTGTGQWDWRGFGELDAESEKKPNPHPVRPTGLQGQSASRPGVASGLLAPGLRISGKNKKAGQLPGFSMSLAIPRQTVSGRQRHHELDGLQVFRGGLARTAVLNNFEADLLAFDERRHAGALNGGDVDENVVSAVFRLDEAEAFGGIEELNGSDGHNDYLSIGHGIWVRPAQRGTVG